jgi:uncharacterized protein (TIGR02284 family)
MDNTEVISILNDLVAHCKQGEYGFATAAITFRDPQLKMLLKTYSAQQTELLIELRSKIRSLGGQSEMSKHVQQHWQDSQLVVEGGMLRQCEQTAEATLEVYRAALKCTLPVEIQMMVWRQYILIKEEYDHLHTLHDVEYAYAGSRT